MIAILLAVATALGWGASDYFGGDSSRHETPVFVVLAIVQAAGLVILVPVLVAHGIAPPLDDRLLLAAIAGAAVTVELGVVYAALSRGDTFIGAPTGALGAAIAVVFGLISGDPIGLALALGLVCALLGGGISAWASPADDAQAGWRSVAVRAGCVDRGRRDARHAERGRPGRPVLGDRRRGPEHVPDGRRRGVVRATRTTARQPPRSHSMADARTRRCARSRR